MDRAETDVPWRDLGAQDPSRIGPWVVRGRLGAGGMGVVYLASHHWTGEHVALKVVHAAFAHVKGYQAVVVLSAESPSVSEACETNVEDMAVECRHRVMRVTGRGSNLATIPLVMRTARARSTPRWRAGWAAGGVLLPCSDCHTAAMTISGMPSTYDDLRAVYVNCTLKRSPATSHTQHLLNHSAAIVERAGARVTHIRAADHDIAFGMSPDMSEVDPDDGGADTDDWPAIERQILDADILVIGTPIWLGEKSSVATMVIERLYSWSSETNDKGQYLYYGKTGGVVVTGNEDGVKHCAANICYALAHIGYTIPPQPDCGWIGEIGPGPSYGDEVEGSEVPLGFDHEFTMKNTTFMTWNLLHTARMLVDAGGVPAFGNVAAGWDAGERWGYPDPIR